MKIIARKKLSIQDIIDMTANLSRMSVKMSPTPVCDFCGAAHPAWFYAASRNSLGEKVRCWRWCACNTCDHLITNCLWHTLKSRIARRLTKLSGVGIGITTPAVDKVFQEFLLDAFEEIS